MSKSYKRAIQFRSGIKLSIEESLFNLGNLEPQENMDVYITVQGNRFTCFKPLNYMCHFIGNVRKNENNFYDVYVVSIENDTNPISESIEIAK